MLSRRSILVLATLATSAVLLSPALAASPKPFDAQAFAEARKAGLPILVAVHASWCPTCKAQKPILGQLTDDPKFKSLAFFVVDFDSQKDLVKQFGVRMQSTLIAFKGDKEADRSVGDTNRATIAALLDKAL